ncbi:MAG: sigma-70 family RNA polymerase sigma factor [Reyranella sp.]|uniref:sigma-70 family RNA polymerase sigma factor n=1 Tax=Reyranella sp. TaxID=1929291 RepID=UPI002731358F|nr:sigma-70 family RNA polymerase sigma factor [Reyranella sp.]MDP1964179.1 sigma-70 family RNA polymerase sigma factor [Reyranella sp.]MDP2373694.1 sigma-70 family RNA polymerase sigma factor [Reyranella sp.]
MAIETSTTNTSTINDFGDFHEQLTAVLPRLRIYALSLTRNRDSADDLVHDAVVKALAGRQSFQPGTNLAAWLFRIQRNEFISGLRRLRPTVPVDSAVAESLSHPPHQDSGLVMREFLTAFSKLAQTQREALLLAVVEGLPYEVIAAHTGVSVGTVKSRISRARDRLEHLLIDGDALPWPADDSTEGDEARDDASPAATV